MKNQYIVEYGEIVDTDRSTDVDEAFGTVITTHSTDIFVKLDQSELELHLSLPGSLGLRAGHKIAVIGDDKNYLGVVSFNTRQIYTYKADRWPRASLYGGGVLFGVLLSWILFKGDNYIFTNDIASYAGLALVLGCLMGFLNCVRYLVYWRNVESFANKVLQDGYNKNI